MPSRIGENLTDWDKIAKQKMMYQELDKFKPGEHLQYYPVPAEDKKKWQEEHDRIALEKWEQHQIEVKKVKLDLYDDKPRSNGHESINTKVKIDCKGKGDILDDYV